MKVIQGHRKWHDSDRSLDTSFLWSLAIACLSACIISETHFHSVRTASNILKATDAFRFICTHIIVNDNKLLQYLQQKTASAVTYRITSILSTARVCGWIFPILYNRLGDVPPNCPFPWGAGLPLNTWFLRPTRVHSPNGILIGSAGLYAHGRDKWTHRQTDRHTDHATSVTTGHNLVLCTRRGLISK